MHVDTLAQQWGLVDIQASEQKSGRVQCIRTGSGQEYYLKRHGHLDNLPEYPVLQFLNQQGIRTELPIPTLQGQALARQGEHSFALYRALPGASMSDHYSDKREQQAYQLGRAIGQLHRGLAQYSIPDPSPFPNTDILSNISHWDGYLRGQQFELNKLAIILKELSGVMPGLYPHLIKHLIHRDSHPSNILFDELGQPGFLDFELLRTAVRIFDPCYCSTSLLVDAGSDEAKRRVWPQLFRQIMAGYDAICPLKSAERQALRYVVFAIQIIFVGWWTQNGNYEQANLNARQLFWLYENCPEV